MKDISVIVISYNEAEYLERAIESCLEQKFYGGVEIIIGDDGSTDNSLEIINRIECQHPETVKHFVMDRSGVGTVESIIPSIRVSNVIRRGLSVSSGKYIVVLSADDYFCSNHKFLDAYNFLENDKNKKYAAFFTNFKYEYSDGKQNVISQSGKAFRSVLIARKYFHLSCFVFRREVYSKGYLCDRLIDDCGLVYSMCLMGRVYHYDDISFSYVQREGSIMHEADTTELAILELMLMQDWFNKGKYRFCSLSRFSGPVQRLFLRRKELDNKKYNKYYLANQGLKNDFLRKIQLYDNSNVIEKLKIRVLIFRCKFSFAFFSIVLNAKGPVEGLLRRIKNAGS